MAELTPEDEQLVNDMMPNSAESMGIYMPDAPEELIDEEAEERSIMATAYPIVEELIEWFGLQIEGADSVRQAHVTAQKYGIPLEDALVAHDTVAQLLASAKDNLETRFGNYQRAREEGDDE